MYILSTVGVVFVGIEQTSLPTKTTPTVERIYTCHSSVTYLWETINKTSRSLTGIAN